MLNCRVSSVLMSVAAVVASLSLMATVAHAQAVGDPAPVAKKAGLLAEYYSFSSAVATPPGNPPGSPDPTPPVEATAAYISERLEPVMTINYQGNPPPGNNNSSDYFMAVYTGFINVTTADNYTFQVISDDGERSWFGNPASATPDKEVWVQRGTTNGGNPDIFNKGALPLGNMPIRIEFEEGNGGVSIQLQWSRVGATTIVDIPTANLVPPDGPAAPTLVANAPIQPPPAVVHLTWNATAPTTGTGGGYIISRATTVAAPGAPLDTMKVLAIINTPTTVSYDDNAVVFGATYQYIIQAYSHSMICIGNASAPQTVTPQLPAVIAFPNSGLQTNENGASTTFTIQFTQPAPGGGSVLTVTSSNVNEGTVAANGLVTTPVAGGFQYTVAAGASPTIVVTVTGVDDTLVDGPVNYQINVAATGFAGPATPPVLCTNNDNDVQGLTFSRTSGLRTTESGGQDSFDVYLNRQPFNNVSFTLMSSNTLEGTVTPGSLTFTNVTGAPYSAATGVGGWNVAHTVTVTGVDDTLLDFTQAYSIITGALTFVDPKDQAAFTAAGVLAAPDVACVNIDNEVPPALPHVWGTGCGLLGAEIALPWLLALLVGRRRRKS